MSEDLTRKFQTLVLEKSREQGVTEVRLVRLVCSINDIYNLSRSHIVLQDALKSLRSSQILRSLGSKSSFSKAAAGVVRVVDGHSLLFV